MQARRDRAAGMAGRQLTDRIPRGNRRSGTDRGRYRLVRRAQSARVIDAHDAPAGDHAGEPHHAGTGGSNGCPRYRRQIHAAVARQPRPRRRIEPADDGRDTVQRPPEPCGRRHCRRHRPGHLSRHSRPGHLIPGHLSPGHLSRHSRPGPGRQHRERGSARTERQDQKDSYPRHVQHDGAPHDRPATRRSPTCGQPSPLWTRLRADHASASDGSRRPRSPADP